MRVRTLAVAVVVSWATLALPGAWAGPTGEGDGYQAVTQVEVVGNRQAFQGLQAIHTHGQKDRRPAGRDDQAIPVLDDFSLIPESRRIGAVAGLVILLRQYPSPLIEPVHENGVILIHPGKGLPVESEVQAGFLVNKYFEWSAKFAHGIYHSSPKLLEQSSGEVLFYGLYYVMTGLHGIHVLGGVVLLAIMWYYVTKEIVHKSDFVKLENSGLYWHLVDIIWIFLFPLFYLIT